MNPKTKLTTNGRGVADFLAQHGSKVTGVVQGFDRLRMQGTLRALYVPEIFEMYLCRAGVLFKNYQRHLTEVSGAICQSAKEIAQDAGTVVRYVRSAQTRKEELVAGLLQAQPQKQGLVAVLSAVEPCRTLKIRGNAATQRLEARREWSTCLHLYFYFIHELFGLMHLRLQTWFPFLVHVCLNGREWLSRQMDRAGLAYERCDNCFPWISDVPKAQALLDQQVQTHWPSYLPQLIDAFHPNHQFLQEILPVQYYWTAAESEYATDIMFRDRATVEAIYPPLVRHAITRFGAHDVLRFLGGPTRSAEPKVESSYLTREEGTRVKHWVNHNSIKVYDKGSVLRTECTINEPEAFRVWRASERDPKGPKGWRNLRWSTADMPRRAEVSKAATDRYIQALATVAHPEPLQTSATMVSRPRVRKGRRYRALNLFSAPDLELLRAINHGDFALQGLRNRTLRARLYPNPPDGLTNRQLACRVSRLLALLRAHGLIARVPKTRLYRITPKGRRLATAALTAASANIQELTKLAA